MVFAVKEARRCPVTADISFCNALDKLSAKLYFVVQGKTKEKVECYHLRFTSNNSRPSFSV